MATIIEGTSSFVMSDDGTVATANASGTGFEVVFDHYIDEVTVRFTSTSIAASADYQVWIVEFTSTFVVQSVLWTDTASYTSGTGYLTLAVPDVLLERGRAYAILVARTNGTSFSLARFNSETTFSSGVTAGRNSGVELVASSSTVTAGDTLGSPNYTRTRGVSYHFSSVDEEDFTICSSTATLYNTVATTLGGSRNGYGNVYHCMIDQDLVSVTFKLLAFVGGRSLDYAVVEIPSYPTLTFGTVLHSGSGVPASGEVTVDLSATPIRWTAGQDYCLWIRDAVATNSLTLPSSDSSDSQFASAVSTAVRGNGTSTIASGYTPTTIGGIYVISHESILVESA